MTEQRRSDGLSTSGLRAGVHLALICVLSFAVLRIFQTPGHAALFWPANGVMTALLLRTRHRHLVPILALSFAAGAAGLLMAGSSPVHALVGGSCNVAEAALTALALRRLVGAVPDLTRVRDLMIFATVSVMVPAASALVATGLMVGYSAPGAMDFLRGWWLADSLGLLIVTPAAMTVRIRPATLVGGSRPRWMTPAALVAVAAIAMADSVLPMGAIAIGGLALLALIGAEYGGAFAAAALLLVSSAALASRLVGGSLFDLSTEQAWLAAQSLVVLAVSSLLAEQRRLQAELAGRLGRSEAERLAIADSDRLARLAGAVAEIGYWRTDFTTGETVWSEAMLGILGLPRDGAGARLNIQTAIQTCVVAEDQAHMFRLSEALRRDGKPWATQVRVIRQSDGAQRLLSLRGEADVAPDGTVTGVVCVGRDITAEAGARAALEESEARYRLVTEYMHDPVLHMALDGTVRFISGAARRYGYEPHDLVGRNARDFIHPDDAARFAEFLALLPGRETLDDVLFETEFRIRTATGEYVWVEGNPALLRNGDGEIDGYVNGLRDITSRKLAELALQESEARYRVLAEASPDVVVRYDLDFRFEYASPRVAEYGFDPDELVGRSIHAMIHPADREFVEQRVREGLARGEMDRSHDRSHRLVTKAGETVWVESRPSIIRSATGEPVAILAQVRNITERRAQHRALAESELRYRTIAERMTDIIAVTGPDGVFRYLSPAIEAATGFQPEELIGQSWPEHVHPDDRDLVIAAFFAIAEGRAETDQVIRYRARRRDGSWVWLESRPVPQRGEDGELDGCIDVIRDVSRHVELEADLRAAKEAAERAALAKSEFLANMSHEIRTPLTAVLGFVGVVSDRPDLAPDMRMDLERIDHAGRTLLSIVNDILEVSKLEAGQVRIERTPCDLRRLTADLIDMFAPQAAARGLSLTLKVSDGVPAVVGLDGDRVRQVAVNLIGNALKFTESGTVGLDVDYAAADERVLFRVHDTGPGLDAQQTAGQFQRFSQVDTSVSRRQGGTGLGLAICRGLVQAMGGEISVDSTPGAGACFSFAIPARPCALPVSEPVAAPDFAGVRLLVVDDNVSNRDLAERIFRNLGFRVDVAASGSEGVAACEATAYDLILMDIRMPELDGPTAARMIRDGEGPSRGCPILAFTADVDAGLDHRYPGLFDGMVRKPIELAQLITEVSACLPTPRRPVTAAVR